MPPARNIPPPVWHPSFLEALARARMAPLSQRAYRHGIDLFVRWFQECMGKPLVLEELHELDLVKYRQELVEVQQLRPATINQRLQALRWLFRWAKREGMVQDDPAAALRMMRVARRRQPAGLTESEVHALLRASGSSPRGQGPRNYALLQLLLQTGLRVGEVAGLQIGDVVLRERHGRVRVRLGKGEKEREVPLNATARRALRAYLDQRPDPRPEQALFLSHREQPLTVRAIQSLVKPPAREATHLEQEHRIREYLGYRVFDSRAREQLERHLEAEASHGLLSIELYERAEEVLRSWKVQLPAASTLERLVGTVSAKARQDLVVQISRRLPVSFRKSIDELLTVPDGESRSGLARFKEYPSKRTPASIADYIERYRFLESIGTSLIDLRGLTESQVSEWAQLVKRYKAKDLRRLEPSRRHAMVACFLSEAQKTILDYVVLLNDDYITGHFRRAKNAFQKEAAGVRQRSRKSLETILNALETLLECREGPPRDVGEFLASVDEHSLRTAVGTCRELERYESRGLLDQLRARYGSLRQYSPRFMAPPFQAAPGSEFLVEALELARRLNAGSIAELPPHTPIQFVAASSRPWLLQEDGSLDRALWEIELTAAVRNALRSGNLYLPGSRRHLSISKLLYDENRWKDERERVYSRLQLPLEATALLESLSEDFREAARAASDGLSQNTFAQIVEGKLKPSRMDALQIPDSTRQLRRVIETSLPRVRIEDLLHEVDQWCGFTRAFEALPGYGTKASAALDAPLLAAMVAHGTNLGLSAMGHSAEGVSLQQLQHISRWYLREETLQAANAILVDYHHGLDLSEAWGDGTTSSSDGQRFIVRERTLTSSYYPRYFGHYERALSVVSHTSDQYSVFGTRVISCSPREARFVLDGLLENNTVLRPREHCTDTHGYTEHIFGLCYLLGFSFAPRLRDLGDQQLFRMDRESDFGQLDPLFSSTVDTSLILEQWDELARVAASPLQRTSPAHILVQRFASGQSSSRLAKALTALGRIVKTIYLLRYIHEEPLRRRVQRQLNLGEHRHALARWLFFANQGEFCTGDCEEIMNKATCLSLLSNAVLVWNTVQIGQLRKRLQRSGQSVPDEALGRLSPLVHAHVIPSGTYHFDRYLTGTGSRGE